MIPASIFSHKLTASLNIPFCGDGRSAIMLFQIMRRQGGVVAAAAVILKNKIS
jgi:hypothetical protein